MSIKSEFCHSLTIRIATLLRNFRNSRIPQTFIKCSIHSILTLSYDNKKEGDFCHMRNYEKESDLRELPLAMAYVPWQHLDRIYENLEEALCVGTLFPELNKPFQGRRCVKK